MSTVAITRENFETTIQSGIVLLDWWAAWCGPCRAFAPIFEAASTRFPDVTFGKIDTEDQRELAYGFQIQSIPTLMLFRDGILLYSRPGMVPAAALDDLIGQAKALDMEKVKAEIDKREAEQKQA